MIETTLKDHITALIECINKDWYVLSNVDLYKKDTKIKDALKGKFYYIRINSLITDIEEIFNIQIPLNHQFTTIDALVETVQDLINKRESDYCRIGRSRCLSCGWQGDYPVSGCPNCHTSFVS